MGVLLIVVLLAVSVELVFYLLSLKKTPDRISVEEKLAKASDLGQRFPPVSIEELLEKTDSVKIEYSQNSDGTISDAGYISVRGHVYEIDVENRAVLISINFEHKLGLKAAVSLKSPWMANGESYAGDYFPLLKKGDYVFASCADSQCARLSGFKVSTY